MKVYVVTVQNIENGRKRVSGEGYTNRADAVKFIEGRSDYKALGFKFNEFRYITGHNIYEICEINI